MSNIEAGLRAFVPEKQAAREGGDKHWGSVDYVHRDHAQTL
jgi:hypothetical protein